LTGWIKHNSSDAYIPMPHDNYKYKSFPGRIRLVRHFIRFIAFRLRYKLLYRGYRVVFKSPLTTPMPAKKRIYIDLDFKIVSKYDYNDFAGMVPAWRLRVFKKRLKKGYKAIIGYSKGVPVSYGWFAEESYQIENFDFRLAPGEVFVFDAWVSPSFRGKGIAYYNFKLIFEFFRELGYDTCIHFVEVQNRKMLRLCRKIGLPLYGILKHRRYLGMRKTVILPRGPDESRIARRYLAGTGLELPKRDSKISVIKDAHEFLGLKADWERLERDQEIHNFYSTHVWLYTWWKHFNNGNKLLILKGTENGRTTALYPFYINIIDGARTTGRKNLGIPARIIEMIGAGLSCRGEFLVADKWPENLVTMLDYLHGPLKDEWDMMDLHQFSEDSISLNYLLNGLHERGYKYQVAFHSIAPFIPIENHSQDYGSYHLSRRSARTRRVLRKKERKLFEEIGCDFENEKLSPKEIVDIYRKIELRSWKKREHAGLFLNNDIYLFMLELLENLSSDIYYSSIIKTKDEYVGFLFGFIYKRKFYYFATAYNRLFFRFSPGLLLVKKVFEDMHKRDIEEIDLLQGENDLKYYWTDKKRMQYVVRVFNTNSKGRLLKNMYRRIVPAGKSLFYLFSGHSGSEVPPV
jgi:CelD/BcsL family acetyltransferase involved in cellulose biosynthesis/ribosomal protein S18 acetylase RimI-like enzyme